MRRIALEISTDQALERMRKSDSAALAQLLIQREDPLWEQVNIGLNKLLGDERVATIARLWLVGQVLQPLSTAQIHEQTEVIFLNIPQDRGVKSDL